MSKFFTRLEVIAGAAVLAQVMSLSTAHAVPSDVEAWSSIDQKITVFKDAVDANIYWFIPKIRFETSGGKTLLRPTTLANGKVEYITRIIPYFSKDLREEVAQNISNIRQDSQLKPVVAKNIAMALPDFDYKFASPTVTNYQYLDVPRLVRFQLDAAEAKTFDILYKDASGIPVEFTISYDGMMTDKFLNINISCKEMDRELSTNIKPSVGVGSKVGPMPVYVGADLELAFLNTVQNSTNGVDITSKGDITGMQEMLRRVMNLCFDPVDGSGNTSYYPDDTYPTRRTTPDDGTLPGRGDVIDDGFNPRKQFVSTGMTNRSNSAMSALTQEANLLKSMHDKLDLSRPVKFTAQLAGDPIDTNPTDPQIPTRGGTTDGSSSGDLPGLLPSATLKAGFTFKKTALTKDNQAVVKQVELKDTTAVYTVVDTFSAQAKVVDKVTVQSIAERKFTATAKNSAATPLMTGIKINDGEQYTINAEFVFNAASGFSSWKNKQYSWDTTWGSTDGDLYYRLGTGDWTKVNRRAIITSDVTRGGGELQFYIDRSAIFNKIDPKLRKGNVLVGPVFTIDKIDPQYVIQVSGRRINVSN